MSICNYWYLLEEYGQITVTKRRIVIGGIVWLMVVTSQLAAIIQKLFYNGRDLDHQSVDDGISQWTTEIYFVVIRNDKHDIEMI